MLKLTRGSWWPKLLCKVDAGVVVRRRWGGSCGPGGAGFLQAPGLHGSMSGCAAKPSKGSGRAEDHWWRGIVTAGGSSPPAVPMRFRRCSDLGPTQRIRIASWVYSGAIARVVGARVAAEQHGRGGAEERRHGGATLLRRLGLWVWRRRWIGCRGSAG